MRILEKKSAPEVLENLFYSQIARTSGISNILVIDNIRDFYSGLLLGIFIGDFREPWYWELDPGTGNWTLEESQ